MSSWQFRVLWGVVMTIVFFVISYLIYFTPYIFRYDYSVGDSGYDTFQTLRTILAIVFALYAVSRAFRTYRCWKNR